MSASEGCGSCHDAQSGTYRNVNWALFFLPQQNQTSLSKPRVIGRRSRDSLFSVDGRVIRVCAEFLEGWGQT